MTAFEEFATSTFHIGCHMDGLGHLGIKVTPEHLEAAQKRQGVEVKAGDAVLAHSVMTIFP